MAGAAETARLVAELTLKDKMSKGIDSAIGKVDKLGKKTGIAAAGIQTAGKNIQRGLLLGAGAAAAGIALSVKAAGDFEASLNTINTVAQTTEGNLTAIGDGIRQIARDTGTSVDDLGQAYYDLVSAGIKTADAQNVLTQANKLAIGGLSTTAEAVDLLTTAINSYGGDATKAAAYTNMFAEAIGAGKVTASEIAGSFAQLGPIASDFGVGVDEIAAALGVMTAKGTPAAEVMTQMKAAIKLLSKPTADLSKLQKELGVDFSKMAKDKGIVYAYNEMSKAADKAGIPMIALTGRIEAAQFAAQVTGESFAGYNEELDKVRDSSKGAGVAQLQMEQRTKGFNYSMDRLKANVHDAAITIGTELLPILADMATEFSAFLSANQSEIKTFAKDLAGGIKSAAAWAKTLDFKAIGKGLEAAAGFAKALISAFTSMPPQVQATLIGLAGLNKLSGGAVSGIIGELGKGLIKGVLGITAGVVNLKAGTVVGGGGVGGGTAAAAGKGGGVRGAVGAVGKVFLVGMAAAAATELAGQLGAQSTAIQAQGKGLVASAKTNAPKMSEKAIVDALNNIDEQMKSPLNVLALAITNPLNNGLDNLDTTQKTLRAELQRIRSANAVADNADKAANVAMRREMGGAAAAGRATTIAAQRTAAAIRDKNWMVKVNVPVTVSTRVSVRDNRVAVVTAGRYAGKSVPI